MEFGNIIYEKREGLAKITLNRPDVLNALDPKTLERIKRLEDFYQKYRFSYSLPLEEQYAKRHLPLIRASERLESTKPRVANIFTDPLYQQMTPEEQKAVQRYVKSYGKQIGKHFGEKNQALYMDEMSKAMKSPTLRRFAHLGKGLR